MQQRPITLGVLLGVFHRIGPDRKWPKPSTDAALRVAGSIPPASRSGLLANFYRKQCRAKTGRGQFLLQGFGIAGRHRLLDAALEITRPAFEVTLDVFQYAGLITKRHKYEDVIAQPPA